MSCLRSTEILLDPARELVGPHGRDPDPHQRASHQALRVGLFSAEGKRIGAPPLGHPATGSARNRLGESLQLRVEIRLARKRQHLVVDEDAFDAALGRRRSDDVDRGRLDLDQVDVGLDPLQLVAQRVAIGEVPRDVNDVDVVLAAQMVGEPAVSGPRCRREQGDAPAGHGLSPAAAASSSPRPGTSFTALIASRTSVGEPSSAFVSTTRSETRIRYALR